MAGNTEQKIKNLQFKRNKTIFSSFDELVATVKDPAFLRKTEIVEMQDGELLMFRYKDSTGNIATLVGSVYNPDSTTKEIHLEIGTDKIKKIIQEELKNIGDNQSKITINSADKILSLGSDNTLTASLNLVKSGDTLKLIGKNNLVISTITLPNSGSTVNSLSFNWLPQEAKLQLIGDSNKVLSEVDFPFETMVQSSELTTDNKLKLVFNTTKGPQSVLVDLNKLKDIYTAGDSTILVSGNKVSTKVSSKTSTFPITKVSDGLWIDDTSFKEQIENITNRVTNLESKKYTSGDNTIVVNDSKISTKLSIKPSLLSLKKDTDGLGVNDEALQKELDSINSTLATINNTKYVAGDPTIQIDGNRISTILSTKNSLLPLVKEYDGLKIDVTSLHKKFSSIDKEITQLKDKNYVAGDSTINVSGNEISTKISSKATLLPITKEKDGFWVNDTKLTEIVNDLNSLKAKVNNLEAGSGSGGSESNKPKNPTGVNLLFNDTTEFNANSKILQNLNNHPHFYELPLKPITLYQANQVFTFSFSPNEITQIMSGSLNIVLVSSDNKPIPIEIFNPDNLTFNETGWIIGKNNDTITIDLEKMDNLFQTTDSIYSKMGKLFVSFITRGNIEYKIAKLVLNNPGGNNNHIDCFFGDIILEIGAIPSDYSIKRLEFQTVKNRFTNNITLLENKIKKIENNPVSSGDSTIEVTNNKISTKISKTGSYIPLVKKDDGLWIDDSNYNKKTSELSTELQNCNSKLNSTSDIVTNHQTIIDSYRKHIYNMLFFDNTDYSKYEYGKKTIKKLYVNLLPTKEETWSFIRAVCDRATARPVGNIPDGTVLRYKDKILRTKKPNTGNQLSLQFIKDVFNPSLNITQSDYNALCKVFDEYILDEEVIETLQIV